ncbi:MAG TPA: ECF transporter S component [Thermoanaerobacterales bacterium]|nr:ECF transporter S component [Thermoanaerobacterales bacterium]
MNEQIKKLAFLGLFMGLLVIATSVLRFPVPSFNLYFNLGESVIYLVALIYGGPTGALIGGVGSALSDLIAGYPVWAPITFIIKGLEGFIVGSLTSKANPYIAVILGALWMMAGYAISAGILYGIGAVPVELAGDFIQVSTGAVIALFLHGRLKNLSFNDKDKF